MIVLKRKRERVEFDMLYMNIKIDLPVIHRLSLLLGPIPSLHTPHLRFL